MVECPGFDPAIRHVQHKRQLFKAMKAEHHADSHANWLSDAPCRLLPPCFRAGRRMFNDLLSLFITN
jgi:hypothetical protein